MTYERQHVWIERLFLLLIFSMVALLVCGARAEQPQQSTGIEISGQAEPSQFEPNWNVPPEGCPSKLYLWTGDAFRCQPVDRVDILLSQRNQNRLAFEACQMDNRFLRAKEVTQTKYQLAREECRKFGKVFDEEKVECAGALPQEVEE